MKNDRKTVASHTLECVRLAAVALGGDFGRACIWMQVSNPAFHWSTPLEMIAAGCGRQVMRAIEQAGGAMHRSM